ncbi:MAG: RNA polymerase factor sigma-32, partial [Proteobacteria bacterium]|nr:RNA polymerase factor sigma-32 [Pseudomonadota bacterium]
DDERSYTPAAYLPSQNADPATLVEKADWSNDATTRMTAAIKTLDDRSRHILESRWLTDDKQTLHELADVYSISAERIRQIEVNAMKKVRMAMGT